jgi:predicted DNA-binding transcriptional regulator AlpA
MNNLDQQESHTNTGMQQEPLFLNTKEVMVRYRICSTATLWKWRKNLGFPNPIHNGRFYNIQALKKWDEEQLAS